MQNTQGDCSSSGTFAAPAVALAVTSEAAVASRVIGSSGGVLGAESGGVSVAKDTCEGSSRRI